MWLLCLVVALCMKSGTCFGRVNLSRAAPICLTCVLFLQPLPHPSGLLLLLQQIKQRSHGQACRAVQPWLVPSLHAELRMLWETSRSFKTKSKVFHAERGLQMKFAGPSLISDITSAVCFDCFSNVLYMCIFHFVLVWL